MEPSNLVYVKRIKGKGRGVFARADIRRGALIEQVPVLLVPTEQLVGGMYNPALARFFYLWDKNKVAVSLGYGSLYNHSYKPNAIYEHGRVSIAYRALRNIDEGEEITVNYNGDPKDKAPVGFKVIES